MQQYNMPYAMPENMHHSIAGMEAGSGAVANGFRARTRSIYDDPDQAAANLANQKRNNFLELYKPYMDDIAKQVNSRSIVNEGLAGIGSVNDRSAQKQRNAQRRNGASLTPAQKMLFEQTLSNSGVENSVTTANTVREQQRDSNLSVADTLMSLAQGQSSQGSAGLDNITSNAMARDANYRNQKSQAKQSNMAALASVASIAAMFMI